MLKVFSLLCNSGAGHARFASCNCFIFFHLEQERLCVELNKIWEPEALASHKTR